MPLTPFPRPRTERELSALGTPLFAVDTLQPSTPMRSPASNEAQESLTIGIADEHIGAVVGRAGRNITEIIQVTVHIAFGFTIAVMWPVRQS